MIFNIFVVLLFINSVIESKPLDKKKDEDVRNEIDFENDVNKKINDNVEEVNNKLSRQIESFSKEIVDPIARKIERSDATSVESNSIKPEESDNISSLLLPLLNRWKFSPQTFFYDRINLLKQSLENLGFVIPSNNATTSKQFANTNGLFNLIGLNDSGFYTDRLEPAGFLGGNGWFANKGGILGGPGAIISTGSLLTDYPTAYKK